MIKDSMPVGRMILIGSKARKAQLGSCYRVRFASLLQDHKMAGDKSLMASDLPLSTPVLRTEFVTYGSEIS